jgi:hypothetical protein
MTERSDNLRPLVQTHFSVWHQNRPLSRRRVAAQQSARVLPVLWRQFYSGQTEPVV